jgi:glyoxylase-like metal-dependent hydrolase (beta-lactamase superfamily II)
MKIRFLSLFVLSLVLVAGSAFAETVAGLPLHVQKFESGAIRVWIGDHISSTATVAIGTAKGILVIDTLGFPEVDRELRRVIARELGRDDFAYLINTHEHGDHTGGNVVYADCTIVGHELVAAGMVRSPEDRERILGWYAENLPKTEAELAALTADAPERAKLEEGLIRDKLSLAHLQAVHDPVPPTLTFNDRLVLDLGDTTVELFYIGGMHTASDIAVLVPEHGLLLTGDTMADTWLTDTPGCLASFSARAGVRHDFPLWLENWNHLLSRRDEVHTLLPGHWNGELSWDGAEERVRYVETLWNEANRQVEAGGRLEDFLQAYRLTERFPHLAEAKGFAEWTNAGTILEMWACTTNQLSGAQALFDLIESGADEVAIDQVLDQKNADNPTHYFIEADVNRLGYRFLQTERPEQAVQLFRINAKLFPESWNCYDSLGEGLLAVGDQEGAVVMYKKSLELNPENQNGKEMLEKIRSGEMVN